jgi:hypothetical protein
VIEEWSFPTRGVVATEKFGKILEKKEGWLCFTTAIGFFLLVCFRLPRSFRTLCMR